MDAGEVFKNNGNIKIILIRISNDKTLNTPQLF
jgi:hypothetical protein